MNDFAALPASVDSPDSWEVSYERVLPEIRAIRANDVLPVNLEIVAATTRAIGALSQIQAFREQLAALHGFDVRLVDNLEDYAQAAACAHLRHTSSQLPPDDLRELSARVTVLRENFLVDVNALIHRGLIRGEVIRDLRGANGYKNLVADLFTLGDILHRNWATVAGKCGTTREELEEARALVAEMQKVVGRRETSAAVLAETAELRARAFTLFMKSYDEIRRGIVFLRWKEGDADRIAPSLFAGRSNGRRREDEAGGSDVGAAPAPIDAEEPTMLGLPTQGKAVTSGSSLASPFGS